MRRNSGRGNSGGSIKPGLVVDSRLRVLPAHLPCDRALRVAKRPDSGTATTLPGADTLLTSPLLLCVILPLLKP
jgi:hypothetical protein